MPDGTAMPGDADMWFWAYHHAVVLHVDGELRVLDLSIGDEPLAIDTWLAGFVDPSVECVHQTDEDHQIVWNYWNAAFGNFEPEPRPTPLCSYTLTPIFTFGWDDTAAAMASTVANAPLALEPQTGALATWLADQHDTTLPLEDLPDLTSTYAPGTEQDVCDLVPMRFCDTI
jgi:hypothetical protein